MPWSAEAVIAYRSKTVPQVDMYSLDLRISLQARFA